MKYLTISLAAFTMPVTPVQAAEAPPMKPVVAHVQGAMGLEIPRPDAADFKTVPGVPACTTIAALRGDSSKEGATLMVKMTSGCVVPFHWHHATEEVVMLQGTAITQMLGGEPYALQPGSYSQLPQQHVHRMRCASHETATISWLPTVRSTSFLSMPMANRSRPRPLWRQRRAKKVAGKRERGVRGPR